MTSLRKFQGNCFLAFIALGAAILIVSVDLHAQPLTGWNLIWSDEFNDTAIDMTKWSYIFNEGDPGIAIYTNRDTNSFVANGNLVIRALKENYSGKQYTSTQLGTKNKGDWRYCRMDVRARLPFGQGIWPAIWLLPTDNSYGGWPRSGENDIMENLGDNTHLIYTTIHFGTTNQDERGTVTAASTAAFSDSFYVYSMIWDSTGMKYYLNGVNYFSVNHWSPNNVTYPAPFDKRFYLLLDLAVGGSWAGNPDNTTVFPQEFCIDYVRVYQHSATNTDLPSEAWSINRFSLHAAGNALIYELKEPANIRITLFNTLGQKVAVIAEGYQGAGQYRVNIPANDLKQGMYICRFENITGKDSHSIRLLR